MNKPIFISLIAMSVLSLTSCRTKSGSTDPTPNPPEIGNGKKTELPLLPLEPLTGNFVIGNRDECLQAGETSFKLTYAFKDKSYSSIAYLFTDGLCKNPSQEIYQSGEFSETALADDTGTALTLSSKSETFRFFGEVPDAFKGCSTEGKSENSIFWNGRSSDCNLPLLEKEGSRTKRTDVTQEKSLSVNIEYLKPFGIALTSQSVRLKGNLRVVTPEVEEAEFSICKDLITQKLSEGLCSAINFLKSEPESLIEFEKDSGLFPKLKSNPVSLAAESKTPVSYTVSYRFPCTVKAEGKAINPETFKQIAIFLNGSDSNSIFYLKPQTSDQPVVEVISGHGELQLKQLSQYMFFHKTSLYDYQVDQNCRLRVDLKVNAL